MHGPLEMQAREWQLRAEKAEAELAEVQSLLSHDQRELAEAKRCQERDSRELARLREEKRRWIVDGGHDGSCIEVKAEALRQRDTLLAALRRVEKFTAFDKPGQLIQDICREAIAGVEEEK